MTTTIRKGLLKWARRIGRWIIERLAKAFANHLAYYMRGKVEDFRRRLARAKTARRKLWLRGRIRRWNAAASWLLEHADGLDRCAGDEYDALLNGDAKSIPANCERLVAA